MIKGIGIDIVQISRVKANLIRILSQQEKEIIRNYSEARKALFIAGRFAMKEAIFKAWVEAPRDFSKINIINGKDGKPYVEGYINLQISISHEKEYAVGLCICI